MIITGIKRVTLEEILAHSERHVRREPRGRPFAGRTSPDAAEVFSLAVVSCNLRAKWVIVKIYPRLVFPEPDETHVRQL